MRQRYQPFVIEVVGRQHGEEVGAGRVLNGAFRETLSAVGVGMATAEPIDMPHCGPGACKACDCRGFKATGKGNDVCATCGHYWQIHR
jgi:hypothetical protein